MSTAWKMGLKPGCLGSSCPSVAKTYAPGSVGLRAGDSRMVSGGGKEPPPRDGGSRDGGSQDAKRSKKLEG